MAFNAPTAAYLQDWAACPGPLFPMAPLPQSRRSGPKQAGAQKQQQQQQQHQQQQEQSPPNQAAIRGVSRRKDGQWVNQIPELRKTKMCAFFEQGYCKHGDKCSWAHSDRELIGKPDFSKTKLCASVQRGRPCWSGSCPFAHSEAELRPRADSAGSSAHVPAYVESVSSLESFGNYSSTTTAAETDFAQLGLKSIGTPPGSLPTRTPSRDNSEAASSLGTDSEVLVDLLAGYFQSLLSEKPQTQG
eukprot:CAMPEP_0206568444 /NCGR_PEP_ID=MMETSP0325_2-20121206/25837_1 /ASSEMBLY_ACC=CAM_ASM_000347 /TAXON_ID=2866 /ORGANISM="Crypthecodinium cohnii, Strain Seligo" /LENGTH=244 /DNA_ID=CAMNT_0054071825 /DNA_START=144 /DNA_END=878 /DNA_ORIENTATION=-